MVDGKQSGRQIEPAKDLAGAKRKPYEKPMIVYRQPLEARATVCSPHPPGKSDVTCSQAFS